MANLFARQSRRSLCSSSLSWVFPRQTTFVPRFRGHSRPLAACFSTSALPVDDGAGQSAVMSGGVHDVGGLEILLGQKVDLSDPALQSWEQDTHALLIVLIKKGCLTTDELRRHIESMSEDHYVARTYYCKWATAIALGLIERGVLDYSEIDQELLGAPDGPPNDAPKFAVGQTVRVKSEQSMARWRKPHLRTPGYIFGVKGVVESYEGYFPDPSYKAFRSVLSSSSEEQKEHLYRVVFAQSDVWPEGGAMSDKSSSQSTFDDTVTVEIYESWLAAADKQNEAEWEVDPATIIQDTNADSAVHHHSHNHHDHDHDHDHDHQHLSRAELEQHAIQLETTGLCSSGSIDSRNEATHVVGDRLSAALISILSRPEHLGVSLRKEIQQVVDAMESIKVRADGATLVVRAWTDPAFEERLINDAATAALELGINTVNATAPTKLKVVKSTMPTETSPGVHNLVTCTLCSCYPLSLLGLSPKWYKSRSYRARAVREPRTMLRDSFGLNLAPERWNVRVHDSTADLRYLVLPPRPPNTEDWTEEDLKSLVTRDTMIGVALPKGII